MKYSPARSAAMTEGPVFGKLVLFSLPIILSGVLQLFYNAMDMIIVGRFNGKTALAAVGATGALINLITNSFIGMSLGASVTVSQSIGAGRDNEVRKTVHTAVLLSIVSGIFLAAAGCFLARPMLEAMDTPANVIDQSVLYTQIYFLGMPAMLLYNFESAILRAVGDSRHPMIYLAVSGVLNVFLNIIFVRYLYLGVAGVSAATVISQTLSAVLAARCLMKTDGCWRLEIKKLRIHFDRLWDIIRIGIPAGVQGSMFSLSNVLIQSAINSFGEAVMAGHTAACNIEGFANTAVTGIAQSSMTFVGQNTGARKPERIKKTIMICVLLSVGAAAIICSLINLFHEPLLRLYTNDDEVIKWGTLRLDIITKTYISFGLMDLFASSQRGMGRSLTPMLVSIAGICGFRILWLYTAFRADPTMLNLYISYPASWVLTGTVHLIFLITAYHSLKKRIEIENERRSIV